MSSLHPEQKYVKPKHELNAFNCPHCGVYSHQKWSETYSTLDLDGGKHNDLYVIPYLTVSVCDKCEKIYSVWQKGRLYYPPYVNVPFPDEMLPQEVKEDFLEAKRVFELSPRLACSLLRYTTKKLIKVINNGSKGLSKDVNNLVSQGLPREVGDALSRAFKDDDSCYANEGFLDPSDGEKQALKLFDLLNIIAYLMITKKKEVDNFCK